MSMDDPEIEVFLRFPLTGNEIEEGKIPSEMWGIPHAPIISHKT
jgi:hypothetical protein